MTKAQIVLESVVIKNITSMIDSSFNESQLNILLSKLKDNKKVPDQDKIEIIQSIIFLNAELKSNNHDPSYVSIADLTVKDFLEYTNKYFPRLNKPLSKFANYMEKCFLSQEVDFVDEKNKLTQSQQILSMERSDEEFTNGINIIREWLVDNYARHCKASKKQSEKQSETWMTKAWSFIKNYFNPFNWLGPENNIFKIMAPSIFGKPHSHRYYTNKEGFLYSETKHSILFELATERNKQNESETYKISKGKLEVKSSEADKTIDINFLLHRYPQLAERLDKSEKLKKENYSYIKEKAQTSLSL